MADMGIRPKFVPPFSTGLSRGVRGGHRSQAASYKESCKSSWGCISASVTSMPFALRMAGATPPLRREKNHPEAPANVQEGAGGLAGAVGGRQRNGSAFPARDRPCLVFTRFCLVAACLLPTLPPPMSADLAVPGGEWPASHARPARIYRRCAWIADRKVSGLWLLPC